MVSILARPSGRGSASGLDQRRMGIDTRNWVFLGDSLTEGIGSQRVSHVSELVKCLRSSESGSGNGRAIHHMRLREVDHGLDRFVRFNVAGFLDRDTTADAALWVWNLGCEGRTIEEDFGWVPFVTNLRPECVVIFRGSLESIIRPAMIKDGSWPWWLPNSWRTYSSLDPRCYFSSTWWRRAKQSSLDRTKQMTRRKLLAVRPGKPLMELESLTEKYSDLLLRLRGLAPRILVLGLLPVDDRMFPGSGEYFRRVTENLQELSSRLEVEFLDWGSCLASLEAYPELFYRDGFHPNNKGARVLAEILRGHLEETIS
jgi:lysophospholipase L1-like esterase